MPPKGADEGAMIERFRSPQGDISSPAGGDLLCPWRLVVTMAQATFSCPFGPIHLESTPLRFRLAAKTAFVPLLLLFPANPLRWASPGVTRDWAKRTGDGSRWALRAHIRLSPDPYYGGYPLGQTETFRRAKSEWQSKFLPGHWVLGLQKLQLVRFQFCA